MAIPAPLAFSPSALRGVTAGSVLGNEIGSSGTRGKALTSAELKAIVEASGISYLPLSGGTLSGALNIATNESIRWNASNNSRVTSPGTGTIDLYSGGFITRFSNGAVSAADWIGIGPDGNNPNVRLYHGGANVIEQRNDLNSQCFDLFETYTSGTNNGKLRFKATSSGHQIGSARATSGSNRTVNLGHFDASDVFTASLKIGTDGHVMFPTGLYDNANQRQMAFGGGFIQVDQNLYVQQPIFHAARSTITVDNNYGSIWVASTFGTKDGVTYAVGDVLITTVTSSVSKTVLLVDYSAI